MLRVKPPPNIRTITPLSPTGTRSSYPIFLRRCTTSPRSPTPSRLPWLSIRNTQLRFSTKQGDDYKLIGVMYTATKRFTEDQLNERIPLSVAQWHQHTNFCRPPDDR